MWTIENEAAVKKGTTSVKTRDEGLGRRVKGHTHTHTHTDTHITGDRV